VRSLAARLGLQRSELLLLGAFVAMSVTVLLALLARPLTMTGAESGVTADQLQYFAWMRSAGENIVIENLWDTGPRSQSYFFHPGFLLPGLLAQLGLSIPLAYQLLWKPVAVAVVFTGFLLYVRRLVAPGGARITALAIALFYVSPLVTVVHGAELAGSEFLEKINFLAGEMFPGVYLWGYMMTAIAVGLLPLTLLAAERARVPELRARGRSTGWYLGWASAGALVMALLQPWQGVALIVTVVAVEALGVARRPAELGTSVRRLGPVVAAACVPLVYYAILERVDTAWELAGHANRSFGAWPLSAWILGLLPLAIPAALAYRHPAAGWQQLAVRVLPFAMVGEYALIAASGLGTFPFHSIQGMSLPLAVLAVNGILPLRPAEWWRSHAVWVGVGLAVLLGAGVAERLNQTREEIHEGGQPYFMHAGEERALAYLDDLPSQGAVLAPIYSGLMVPYKTGRRTYVGQISWTPRFREREQEAESLFSGELGRPAAARLIARSNARFLFADCLKRADLEPLLRPYLASVRRFGCASVYEVRRAALP
jgi:hypothetical protein